MFCLKLATILFLTFITIESRSTNKYRIYSERCIQESQVQPELLHNAMVTQLSPENVYYKKYLFCLLNKMGVQTNEGYFVEEKAKQFVANIYGFDDKTAGNVVGDCLGFTGQSEASYLMLNCAWKRMAELQKQSSDEDENINNISN